jgi:hypothetical protein
MMGVEAHEKYWVTHKRQVINLWKCCIWLVNLFELCDDARTCKRQIQISFYFFFTAMKNLSYWPINSLNSCCENGSCPGVQETRNICDIRRFIPLFKEVTTSRKRTHDASSDYITLSSILIISYHLRLSYHVTQHRYLSMTALTVHSETNPYSCFLTSEPL